MKRVFLVVFLVTLLLGVVVYGQSMEEAIKNRIVSEASLDPDLVEVILYDHGGAQLMLTFIYINERTLQSDLNQDIKDAIRPYQDQAAILVMATAQGEVSFDPYQIYVSQGGFKNRVEPTQVIKVTSDFEPGLLQQATSKGIVLLQGINSTKEFVISYKDSGYRASVALKSKPPEEREQPQPQPGQPDTQFRPTQPQSNYFWGQNNYFWGMLKYAVVNLLMVLLLPVLVL